MIYETIGDLVAEGVHELAMAYTRYVELLPQLSGAARSEEVRSALDSRLESAREDRSALATLGTELGRGPSAEASPVMEGFTEKIREVLSHEGDPLIREIDLLGAIARLERDFIASLDQLYRHAEVLRDAAARGRLVRVRRHAESSEKALLAAARKASAARRVHA